MDDHTQTGWRFVSLDTHNFVNPTSATTVEVMLMPLLLMGSAVSKAKAIFYGMLLSMPSYVGHQLQLMYHQPLSPLAYADQVVSDPMVATLPRRNLASVIFGALLVLTSLQPHTHVMQEGS